MIIIAARRDKGDGSVYQQKDGRWVARINLGKGYGGKRKVKVFYGKTKKEVKEKMTTYKNTPIVHSSMSDDDLSKWTLNQLIDYYLTTYKMGKIKYSSYDRLEDAFENHIKTTIGYIQVCNFTTDDVQALFNEMAGKYSLSTIKKIGEVLNPVMDYAVSKNLIPVNPMSSVKYPKSYEYEEKAVERVYTEGELEKLTSTICNDSRVRCKYAQIFIFMWNTGLRFGEVQALTWNDIDFKQKKVKVSKTMSVVKNRDPNVNLKRVVKITTPKSKSSIRTVPLNSKAIAALESLRSQQSEDGRLGKYILTSERGNIVDNRNAQHALERICKLAGVEYKTIHAFRHTFATRCLIKGIDVKTVSSMLGHSKASQTLNIYAHVIKEQEMLAVQKLEDI